jgi:hypothetical protein
MGGVVLCAVLSGCGKGDKLKAASYGDSVHGEPCGASPVIDGAFTDEHGCAEYPGPPVVGKFTDFYALFGDGKLSVLNDWHLRDDAPAERGMYNRFTFACASAQYLLRVYAGGGVEAFRDGVPFAAAAGAAGFRASPRHAKPHTIFELQLSTGDGDCYSRAHDPCSGGQQGGDWTPESVLVEEPTVFHIQGFAGTTHVTAVVGPVLLESQPASAQPGQVVVLVGAALGTSGSVRFGGVPAEVRGWSAERIQVVVPEVYGETVVLAETEGGETNALSFLAPCTPTCAGKACGDDGCGGTCGACGPGTTCQSGQCACAPDCTGKECGDDGCGGSCGACGPGKTCRANRCACAPDCAGKACGDDGCGGTCGACPAGTQCAAGACVPVPN